MPKIILQNEKQLILKLKGGDRASFNKIYETFWSKLYLSARGKLRSEEDAQDMVQEVFIALWNQRAELEDDIYLEAYLHILLKNKIFNFFRKNASHQKYRDYLELFTEIYQIYSDDTIEIKEMQQVIHAAQESMPDKMRLIFEMSRWDELSNKEIAFKLSLSEQTIKNQISTALQIIRTYFKIHYYEPTTLLLLGFYFNIKFM
jgi:RNA polymerase sigma-70 factor, ECF subfamily